MYTAKPCFGFDLICDENVDLYALRIQHHVIIVMFSFLVWYIIVFVVLFMLVFRWYVTLVYLMRKRMWNAFSFFSSCLIE